MADHVLSNSPAHRLVDTSPRCGPPVLSAGAVLLAAAGTVAALTSAGSAYVMAAVIAYLPVAAGVMIAAPRAHPYPVFGLANGITLFRAVLVCLAAGLIATPEVLATPAHEWLLVAGVTLALVLDLADGWTARHQRLASEFGGRFDMEVDAWSMLILSGVVVIQSAAPVWALAIGLARYGFIVAGLLMPLLAAPLPPSRRRRAVCGMQVIALGALLAPSLPAAASWPIAAAALAALALSFALDICWLIRTARR
ncbi:MAG: CDP-alcohol phosphatidyltransferase family protein [Alphaproteobacteria bacterium]|nr:CDP-alcohol phosphatidyltransferase family protein [Alphaproteobacteria bacterium]